ncbi:aldo/keto reductase [Agrococcus jejuensis]|uniref:aldo/keto reductase n=1 Tax=Agrococcus jejuensis TaxID=399736 RepID=UPI0011A9ABA9|nr:aldo/keto reductase [Agrococcus jejuensis]
MTSIPTVALNDGTSIPQLGFGVFKVNPAETERIVTDALEAGYRHIDTAAVYGNEEGVGRAIAASGIARDELYVTTKCWNDDQGRTASRDAMASSLEKLGLERVDLYLIHWPCPEKGLWQETWTTFQELQTEGLTTSIGVSNFDHRYLPALLAEGGPKPVVDQIELHPQFQQRETAAIAAEHDILLEAWGPLGQGKVDYESQVASIAAAHDKTWAQVLLRWHLQHGHIVFPKSNRASRMRENAEVFDFELTADEIATIDALDQGAAGRVSADPAEVN